MRHDYVMSYAGYGDKAITSDEWGGFWRCHHDEPKAWYAYAWLQEAERFGGEGHVTMSEEHIAEWLSNTESFPMFHLNYDEVLKKLQAFQKDS